jgi:uncharacterized membrane-anchored protein
MAPALGPMKADLGHELVIDIPAGFLFFDAPKAKKLAAAMGNVPDDSLLGIIAKAPGDGDDKEGEAWFVEVSYFEEGYVKDDDKLDASAILDSIREGTEEANKVRKERGFKELHVDGWAEPPRYEKAQHHLVWAVKGSDADGSVINYNTRILGRRGVASLNLVASPDELPKARPNIVTLLAATRFGQGARYEDFSPKTDKVAEFGLAALVAGGAGAAAVKLVKVGLLAKFGAVILKFLVAGWKLFLVGLIALGGFFRRLFGLKDKKAAAASPAAATDPPPSPPQSPSTPPSPSDDPPAAPPA